MPLEVQGDLGGVPEMLRMRLEVPEGSRRCWGILLGVSGVPGGPRDAEDAFGISEGSQGCWGILLGVPGVPEMLRMHLEVPERSQRCWGILLGVPGMLKMLLGISEGFQGC